jgi:hypothetical protein
VTGDGGCDAVYREGGVVSCQRAGRHVVHLGRHDTHDGEDGWRVWFDTDEHAGRAGDLT